MNDTAGEIRKHRSPGAGKRRDGRHPKGRQIEERALIEVCALLGDRPRQRFADRASASDPGPLRRHLSAAHLRCAAEEMRLPQTTVYEAATFYAFRRGQGGRGTFAAAHSPGV